MFASLFPSARLTRRLSLQAALFALGQGSFLTGSAVFFTRIAGLTPAEVGLGLTVAGAVSFFAAVPLGRVADRIGPKRMWAIGAFLHGGLYMLYPWVHGFAAFLAVIVAIELADAAGISGRGAYTLNAFSGEERISSLAYMRSALNIGFTAGALVGGMSLALDSAQAIRAVPLATGALLLVNAALIARLPRPAHAPESTDQRDLGPGALRNRGFLLLNVCLGVLSTSQVLINVVVPLWLVQETDAPRWLLAWLFATNTILVVTLQVRASRGAHTVSGALRTAWRSAICLAVSCVVMMVTDSTTGWVTIALIWFGHVVLTVSELFVAAADWGLSAELSDPARRGEYQGVAHVGNTLGTVWAPAVYTFLAMHWSAIGWLIIVALILVAAGTARPAARAAERRLQMKTSLVHE
ncbi:MFS transporter [Streptomyces sp. NPDC057623]|uniref:MFS transporter n=1 Tax=Streptomyces sp. NPDC057623 TaxID=3346187 RepID=UPI00368EF7F5